MTISYLVNKANLVHNFS